MLKYLKVCVLVLAAHLAFAGNANNVFEGKVSDQNTGESIAGAKVVVKETGEVAYTDFDGMFSVKGLETGKYTIQVSFLGYEDAVSHQVAVNDKCVRANISLSER